MDRVRLVRVDGVRAYRSLNALPQSACALFGADSFSTHWWYRAVEEGGLAAGETPLYLFSERPGLRCMPLCVGPCGVRSLTTPYTVTWYGLDVSGPDLHVDMVAPFVRRHGAVRLDCMPAPAQTGRVALRAGMFALPFVHFGNWHAPVRDETFETYLSARPGQLREAVRRKGRSLDRAAVCFRISRGADALDAYDAVHARSWKAAEPFPRFLPALVRAAAEAGALRISTLHRGNRAIAAQIWTVHGGEAAVHKLVHDEGERAFSPGTVLAARTIEALMGERALHRLDWGRGDDAYKALWADRREPRFGVVLASVFHPRGAAALARHAAGRARAWLRK